MTRKLHIISGLILFAFVALHLTNLALGVFSLKVADDTRPILMAPFANPVGGLLLIASMLLHMVLGLQSLYKRNTLRMSRYDTVQYVSAFLIPPLLIPHVWGLIASKELLGLSPSYLDLFRLFWVHSPLDGLRQVLLVVILWIHGCIGLFTWLKLKSWWSRYSTFAYPLAVAIPVVALLGFVAGGNHIVAATAQSQENARAQIASTSAGNRSAQISSSPADVESSGSGAGRRNPPPDKYGTILAADESQEVVAFIAKTQWQMIVGYLVVLMFVLVARQLRVRSNNQLVEVRYADGRVVVREAGPTLLELANLDDIPHANLCRGRGRCGTCRVEITATDSTLAPPSRMELDTLARVGSADNVRLACQLSPGPGVIQVKRLLSPNVRLLDQPIEQDDQEETAQSDKVDASAEGSAV